MQQINVSIAVRAQFVPVYRIIRNMQLLVLKAAVCASASFAKHLALRCMYAHLQSAWTC
jgi:hypothetical protein